MLAHIPYIDPMGMELYYVIPSCKIHEPGYPFSTRVSNETKQPGFWTPKPGSSAEKAWKDRFWLMEMGWNAGFDMMLNVF